MARSKFSFAQLNSYNITKMFTKYILKFYKTVKAANPIREETRESLKYLFSFLHKIYLAIMKIKLYFVIKETMQEA